MGFMKRDKSINRGNAMTMILAVLCDGPRHGYDIAREVERRSGKFITFNDGTLYPILHALEQEGLIDSVWDEPPGERKRRVYSINARGREEYARQVEEWRQFSKAVNDVLSLQLESASHRRLRHERL